MSVESLALVLHHSQASGTPKVVLLGIANHDGDGGAWPAIATLAKYARCSESSVHRAVSRLVEMGELKVQQNAGGTPSTRPDRRPNRYEIALACPPDCDGTTQHGVSPALPRDEDGLPPMRERGAAGASNGVPPVAPEPSLEPSKEPSPVVAVWDAWRESTGRTRSVLDAKRKRLITARLGEFSVDDLLAAVRGWGRSPFHTGQNDRRKVYNDLELLLRDAAHVEQFRDLATDRSAKPSDDGPRFYPGSGYLGDWKPE